MRGWSGQVRLGVRLASCSIYFVPLRYCSGGLLHPGQQPVTFVSAFVAPGLSRPQAWQDRSADLLVLVQMA